MDQPAQAESTYDLYFIAGKRRFFWRNHDHGVTLGMDRLSWTAGGREDEAPLDNVIAVRLYSGGDWRNATNMCEIRSGNGTMITVMDGGTDGLADNSRTPVYREFVRALHAKLLGKQVAFSSGYTQGQYMIVCGAAVILIIMFVLAPLVLLAIIPRLEIVGLLVAGGFAAWPLYKMVNNNAPRGYDPRWPPGELME